MSILFFAATVGSTTEKQKGFFSGMKRTMMTLQNPTLSTHLFTGSRNVCGKPGKGGERCVPFGKMAKSDFALSVLFLNCCRMCPEKFAQKLLLLDISIHIQKKLQRRFNKVVKKRGHGRKEKRKRRRSSADSTFVETEEQFDVNSLFYGDGDQITESLPCCDVCPEQFYAPEDYDDISDPIGDPPSSMFIETKMKEKMKEKVKEKKKEKEKKVRGTVEESITGKKRQRSERQREKSISTAASGTTTTTTTTSILSQADSRKRGGRSVTAPLLLQQQQPVSSSLQTRQRRHVDGTTTSEKVQRKKGTVTSLTSLSKLLPRFRDSGFIPGGAAKGGLPGAGLPPAALPSAAPKSGAEAKSAAPKKGGSSAAAKGGSKAGAASTDAKGGGAGAVGAVGGGGGGGAAKGGAKGGASGTAGAASKTGASGAAKAGASADKAGALSAGADKAGAKAGAGSAKAGDAAKGGAGSAKGGAGSAKGGASGFVPPPVAAPPASIGSASMMPLAGMSIDPKTGMMSNGYHGITCCTVCPEEKFPERYIGDTFKGATSFLEEMERRRRSRGGEGKRKGFLGSTMNTMGGGGGHGGGSRGPSSKTNVNGNPINRPRPECCPMCPSLDHMVHGSMEPFGGVFGDGKLGGTMSELMAAEHALDKSKLDPGLDVGGGAAALGGAAMGAAANMFRL